MPASRPCYLILAPYGSLTFSTMFIWLIAACGISLLPAVDEGFLPILREAPPLDLYSPHSDLERHVNILLNLVFIFP